MSDPQTLFCSDCGTQLKEEQMARLRRGESTFCEKCGKEFKLQYTPQESSPSNTSNFKRTIDLKKMGLDTVSNIKKGTDQAKNWIKSKISKKKDESSSSSSSSYSQPPPSQTAPNNYSYSVGAKSSGSSPNVDIPSPDVEVVKDYQSKSSFPRRELPPDYVGLRKFNDFSAIFALLVAMIASLITFIPLYVESNGIVDSNVFLTSFLNPIVRIVLALGIVIYDAGYARKKILRMELQSYGLDMILVGAFGLLAWGAGFFLLIKGLFVIGLALTDKGFNPKLYGSFWDALFKAFNVVGGMYGLITLFLHLSEFINPTGPTTLVYGYIALISILVDLCVLVPMVSHMKKQRYPFAIALMVCGILAMFFFGAGIVILAQGVILFFVALFSS